MACHNMDMAFGALKLNYPYAVEASSTDFNTESAPIAEVVTNHFPARDNLPKVCRPLNSSGKMDVACLIVQ